MPLQHAFQGIAEWLCSGTGQARMHVERKSGGADLCLGERSGSELIAKVHNVADNEIECSHVRLLTRQTPGGRCRVGGQNRKAEDQVSRNIVHLDPAVGLARHRLRNKADLRLLTVLVDDLLGEARRARIDPDARDKPGIDFLDIGRQLERKLSATWFAGSSAIARKRPKSASDQSRPCSVAADGPFRSDNASRLPRSPAFLGTGNRIETSLAASGRGFGVCALAKSTLRTTSRRDSDAPPRLSEQ